MSSQGINSHVALPTEDVALLHDITADLPILADLCRADLLLFCRDRQGGAIVVAQARPHSATSLYEEGLVGRHATAESDPAVVRMLRGGGASAQVHPIYVGGAAVARQVFPVANARGATIAALAKDASWLAHERHRRRSKAFQSALTVFIEFVLRGELLGADGVSPFGHHDGIMYVGPDRRIQYMSGIASELYRHLGYIDSLVDRQVSEIATVDQQLVSRVLTEKRCLQLQSEQNGLTWMRTALPCGLVREESLAKQSLWARLQGRRREPPPREGGVLILVHDATEALETERELESKMAMIREVHHRVKNNLQIVASIMRLQGRRVQSAEARAVLDESVSRVLSIAVVHEFLSRNAKGTINLQELALRIVGQIRGSLIGPDKRVELMVEGPDIWLPAERATQCALIINELVQNAIEHGLANREQGRVEIELLDLGQSVSLSVADDGEGLPPTFDLEADANLGLKIVRSMVERDLRGEFELLGSPGDGTRATALFDKLIA